MILVRENPGFKESAGEFAEKAELLRAALLVAVPLWGERIARLSPEERCARAHACAQIVASKGDVIQFRTKGETAPAFNALAEGLACLALQPGGVKFLGLLFYSSGEERV